MTGATVAVNSWRAVLGRSARSRFRANTARNRRFAVRDACLIESELLVQKS